MRGWLSFLTRNRLLEIALAVTLGIAALQVVERISEVAVTVLSQHAGRDLSTEGFPRERYNIAFLNFSVADTIVVYGYVLAATLTLGLVALVGIWVIRRRSCELGECPFCASRIPYESTHCAYCGSSVAPGEP